MDIVAYRLLFASVAICPALLVALLPTNSFGIPLGIAVGVACGVYGLLMSLRPREAAVRRKGPALLRASTLRRPPKDLPALSAQRLSLAESLSAAVELRAEPEAPPSRATAVARILARLMNTWNVTDVAMLPRDLTITLSLLERLLTTSPGEAGRIAQMFQRADVVLRLRDEIDRIARTREAYDRAFAAFQATRLMYAADPAPLSLTQALDALRTPDPDLWHHVVQTHDPSDHDQRDAAVWCIHQPACDRATVAAFLARLPDGAQLATAALDGDDAFLEEVHDLITRCNDGYYTRQDLAYRPPVDATKRLAQELDALATLMQDARWPDPQCVFQRLEGRTPRPRPAWDMTQGRVIRAPNRADYL